MSADSGEEAVQLLFFLPALGLFDATTRQQQGVHCLDHTRAKFGTVAAANSCPRNSTALPRERATEREPERDRGRESERRRESEREGERERHRKSERGQKRVIGSHITYAT